jgi:hypothetical protein
LRELADQAGALSEEARQAIGRALQDAARTIEQRDPALAGQVRQSARDIAGQQRAAQGLEELAQAIDRLGQSSSASAPSSNEPGDGQANTPGVNRDNPVQMAQTSRARLEVQRATTLLANSALSLLPDASALKDNR